MVIKFEIDTVRISEQSVSQSVSRSVGRSVGRSVSQSVMEMNAWNNVYNLVYDSGKQPAVRYPYCPAELFRVVPQLISRTRIS
jgi:hypothetical protein